MTDTVTLYGIPNCDTIKKARGWLREHDIDVAGRLHIGFSNQQYEEIFTRP